MRSQKLIFVRTPQKRTGRCSGYLDSMSHMHGKNQPRTVKAKWLDNVPCRAATDEAMFERKRRRDMLYRISTGRVKNPSIATCIAYGIVKAEDVYQGGTLDSWARPPCVQESSIRPAG